jgi:dTDP-4-amino-4,6-dideoxygalactose transaminase
MRVPFYDIKAQYDELKSEMDRATLEVISSGKYMLGANHNAFESEMAARHRCKHGIALNSGTDALRILMDAVGIGPGDEVITTAFTFVASTETIVQVGARPVFVDIERDHFMMDPAKIEAAITPKTKAILPIHLFGQLANVAEIQRIAEKYELIIIEDSAQAVDCTYQGVQTGNFGVGAGFSFYVTKNLGAAGDAGMIVTNDDEIAEKCRAIRIHGMGRERYYYDYVGYTSRMDEVQAAVLRVKLTQLDTWNRRRAQLAAIYNEELRDTGIKLPFTATGNNHTWHQYSVLTDRRDELQAFLKSHEVDSMIYYPVPLHYHAPYQHLAEGHGSLPVTEEVARQILNLPIQPHLTDEQVRHTCAMVREFTTVRA